MTVTAAFANQAKLDLLSQLSGHTIKCALYTQAAASLDKNSTVYTTTGEVTGAGYTAGGKTLSGFVAALAGDVAYADWNDPVWNSSTITADAAVIYDATNSNHILAVLTFPSASSTNGDWTLQLPAPGATGIVRIG